MAVCVSFLMSLLDIHGAKERHFGRYLASFLQVEFVGFWSATESDAYTGQVYEFVWWSLEAFRGLIKFKIYCNPIVSAKARCLKS